MKITDRFIGDHKTFRKLIKDISQMAGKKPEEWDSKRLIRLVELFKDHLILHSWGEETFYYPAVKNKVPVDGPLINKSYMDRLDEEHKTIDGFVDQLERLVKETPIGLRWPDTYQAFISSLAAHMDKEENEVFPFSEGLIGKGGLEEISNELERRRKEAPAIRRHSSFEERR
jgi:hemerythrin-like domain-containing protein